MVTGTLIGSTQGIQFDDRALAEQHGNITTIEVYTDKDGVYDVFSGYACFAHTSQTFCIKFKFKSVYQHCDSLLILNYNCISILLIMQKEKVYCNALQNFILNF